MPLICVGFRGKAMCYYRIFIAEFSSPNFQYQLIRTGLSTFVLSAKVCQNQFFCGH